MLFVANGQQPSNESKCEKAVSSSSAASACWNDAISAAPPLPPSHDTSASPKQKRQSHLAAISSTASPILIPTPSPPEAVSDEIASHRRNNGNVADGVVAGPSALFRKDEKDENRPTTKISTNSSRSNAPPASSTTSAFSCGGWYSAPLPKPPVPSLDHSIRRLREYAEVVAEASDLPLERFESELNGFCATQTADILQNELMRIADGHENWVNHFWLPAMYLRQRAPLPVNVNPVYVFPRQTFGGEDDWLEFAAALVLAMLEYKAKIDRHEIPLEVVSPPVSDPPKRSPVRANEMALATSPATTVKFPQSSSASPAVPLCMDQYEKVLNCYRDAMHDEDRIHHRHVGAEVAEGKRTQSDRLWTRGTKSGGHILVMCENQPFVVFTHSTTSDQKPQLLPHKSVVLQLEQVLNVARNRPAATLSSPIGAATAGDRNTAAEFWTQMRRNPTNADSLEWIRSATFALCLDDRCQSQAMSKSENDAAFRYESKRRRNGEAKTFSGSASTNERATMESDGCRLLHGFGAGAWGLNRWYDATIQLVVAADGCCGLCIEHSVAEGIVIIKLAEWAIRSATEQRRKLKIEGVTEQNQKAKPSNCRERGNVAENENNASSPILSGSNNTTTSDPLFAPKPKWLRWTVGERERLLLHRQIEQFNRLADDLQLDLLQFAEFGKEAIKAWRFSPDGFVQLAMQLTHFRLHGHLVCSYESATMRRFQFGRVDNIRAATPEALRWVKAMVSAAEGANSNKDCREVRDELRALLQKAADKQALITKENVTGNGIDNHFCALEMIAAELVLNKTNHQGLEQMPALFSEPIWCELFRFPLSTSQVSTSDDIPGTFLFYGPVVSDGYGCAYNIQPELITLAVSTFCGNERTKGEKFRDQMAHSLREMRDLLVGSAPIN